MKARIFIFIILNENNSEENFVLNIFQDFSTFGIDFNLLFI